MQKRNISDLTYDDLLFIHDNCFGRVEDFLGDLNPGHPPPFAAVAVTAVLVGTISLTGMLPGNSMLSREVLEGLKKILWDKIFRKQIQTGVYDERRCMSLAQLIRKQTYLKSLSLEHCCELARLAGIDSENEQEEAIPRMLAALKVLVGQYTEDLQEALSCPTTAQRQQSLPFSSPSPKRPKRNAHTPG